MPIEVKDPDTGSTIFVPTEAEKESLEIQKKLRDVPEKVDSLSSLVNTYDNYNIVNVKDFGATGNNTGNLDTKAIQQALDLAKTEGGITVIIPDGTYRITSYLVVYANTKIIMNPGTILLRSHGGGFFKNGNTGDMFTNYNGYGNITIEGGLLDGNVGAYNVGFNHTGWCRGINLSFRNITFKDVINNHFMDINACDLVLIEKCRFLGYKDITSDKSRDFAEAIQISNHTQLGYGDFGVFDGTPAKNITIRDCYFGSSGTATMGAVATGVGNHGSVYGVYVSGVRVESCIFDNLTFAGVRSFKFVDVHLANNTFLNCQRGVAISNPDGTGESGKDGAGNLVGLPQSGQGYFITNNRFIGTKREHVWINATFNSGIYDRVKDVLVEGNHFISQDTSAIDGQNSAIYLSLTDNCNIINNTFGNTYRTVYGAFNSNLTFKGNKVNDVTTECVFLNEPTTSEVNKGYTNNTNILNNTVTNTGRVAFFIQYCDGFRIEGNDIFSPATETDNQRSAINCANGSKNGVITDNRVVMATTGNKHKYGVEVTNSCYNVQVHNNNLQGKTAPALVSSQNGNFSGFYVIDNTGNQRKVTLNSNGTFVVV